MTLRLAHRSWFWMVDDTPERFKVWRGGGYWRWAFYVLVTPLVLEVRSNRRAVHIPREGGRDD